MRPKLTASGGQISGLLFDLDGTIANTLPLCIQAFRQAIEPLAQRSFTDEDIIATFGPSEEGTIQALLPYYYEQGVADYLRFYEELHTMCPKPFEGISALLTDIRELGIRTGLVTGKGPHSTAISLTYFGLNHLFDYVENGWIHGPRKVIGLQSILTHWADLPANQVWYVGDAPSDIMAAKEVGIPVVGAAWAATANRDELALLQPDQLFTSIEEFDNWVRSAVIR